MQVKLYMLLEIEKIRQNISKLKGIYPFPVRLLEFEVFVVTEEFQTTLVMKKEKVEDDWCLMTQDLKEFDVKHIEACKVLEKIKQIDFKKQTNRKDKDLRNEEDLKETLSRHQDIIHAMERFNRIKEKAEEDNYERFLRRYKEKNVQLLETLCDQRN